MGSSRRVSAGHGIFPIVFDTDALYHNTMSSYTLSYKSNHNVVYSCTYPVVWCPKYRRGVLIPGVDARLKDIIHSVCNESRAELLTWEVMSDHVPLLVEVDPQDGIDRLVRAIKGRSSRLLGLEYAWLKSRLPSLGTHSSVVSTVGGAPLEVITQYIENHKRV